MRNKSSPWGLELRDSMPVSMLSRFLKHHVAYINSTKRNKLKILNRVSIPQAEKGNKE